MTVVVLILVVWLVGGKGRMLPEGKLLEKEEAPEKSTLAAVYSAFSCSICRGFPKSHIRGMEAPFSSEPGKGRGTPERLCCQSHISQIRVQRAFNREGNKAIAANRRLKRNSILNFPKGTSTS